jgi:hypothetical protein
MRNSEKLLACLWDNDPKDQVWDQSRNPARDKGDKECQTKPEGADSKKFSQSTADTCKDAIVTRTS